MPIAKYCRRLMPGVCAVALCLAACSTEVVAPQVPPPGPSFDEEPFPCLWTLSGTTSACRIQSAISDIEDELVQQVLGSIDVNAGSDCRDVRDWIRDDLFDNGRFLYLYTDDDERFGRNTLGETGFGSIAMIINVFESNELEPIMTFVHEAMHQIGYGLIDDNDAETRMKRCLGIPDES